MVEVAVQPAGQEVVGECEDPGGAEGVVGADVGHDGQFGGEGHAGGPKAEEEFGEGSAGGPVADGVEDEFAATVGVLFPAG